MSAEERFGVSVSQMYIIVTMLVTFSVVGSIGNALVLYVFSTTKDNLVSTLFIVVLAVVDFTTCLIIIPFTVVNELIFYNVRLELLCKLYYFLITSNIPFSALVMTAIAVERYFCICHPFARPLTLHRARLVVVVLAIFASGLGVCGSLAFSVYRPIVNSSTKNLTEYDGIAEVEVSVTWQNQSTVNNEVMYYGYCERSNLILDHHFTIGFQTFYNSIFVVCFGVVVILYSLIYRSVLRQRRKRQQMKDGSVQGRHQPPQQHMQSARKENKSECETEIANLAGTTSRSDETARARPHDNEDETDAGPKQSKASSEPIEKLVMIAVDENQTDDKQRLKTATVAAAAADGARRSRIANIKTAAMLFVVTLVFAISYFPALAMTAGLLDYNMIIFYAYFANNVANPIIYSFMNSNFRKQLVSLFCKQP